MVDKQPADAALADEVPDRLLRWQQAVSLLTASRQACLPHAPASVLVEADMARPRARQQWWQRNPCFQLRDVHRLALAFRVLLLLLAVAFVLIVLLGGVKGPSIAVTAVIALGLSQCRRQPRRRLSCNRARRRRTCHACGTRPGRPYLLNRRLPERLVAKSGCVHERSRRPLDFREEPAPRSWESLKSNRTPKTTAKLSWPAPKRRTGGCS
mmetsp:Transcript_55521/g.162239  ORF Transcript_55521/g.162239 Transcript_55521/m.162239 type:complete len:211 (-) Transcript_55521:2494-3126(-)